MLRQPSEFGHLFFSSTTDKAVISMEQKSNRAISASGKAAANKVGGV